MVSSANRKGLEVGGHIATYQSSASLYEVGFNHFFRGKDHPGGGDQIYIQGHGSPGIYARAFLEGRLTEEQLYRFRQEVQHGPGAGLPSYPHPRLMPDFWEFPTVSMGLTAHQLDLPGAVQPLPAQPRHQGHQRPARVGVPRRRRDGRARVARRDPASPPARSSTTSPGSSTATCSSSTARSRGNGKIIQELEANFRGAGWNVIKVVWGREWDQLLARDVDGVLVNQMNTTPDGAVPDLLRPRTATTSASTSSAATRGCGRWSST